jgi:hypothetical protein
MACPRSNNEKTGAGRGKKRIEALRPASTQKLTFAEDNPNPVILISGGGVILYHNKAAVALLEGLGWKEGKGVPEVWYDHIEKAMASRETQKAEFRSAERSMR